MSILHKPAPSTKATPRPGAAGVPHQRPEHGRAEGGGLGAATGAAVGAALGSFAGPPGIITGAVLGAAAGGAAGVALAEANEKRDSHDELLDEEIGVIGGDIGAAPPNAPEATRGTYSASSVGADTVSMTDDAPDEGPIPHGD